MCPRACECMHSVYGWRCIGPYAWACGVCVCVCAVAGEGRLQRAEDLAVERLDDRRVLHEAREFLPVLARLRHCLQLRLHLRVDHVRREVEREQPVGLIQQVDDCAPEPAQVPELAS